jgi:hypothetical protein
VTHKRTRIAQRIYLKGDMVQTEACGCRHAWPIYGSLAPYGFKASYLCDLHHSDNPPSEIQHPMPGMPIFFGGLLRLP